MKYSRKTQVSIEFLENYKDLDNREETVIKNLINGLINDLPLDILKSMFKVKVLDPRIKQSDFNNLNEIEKHKIELLRYYSTVEYECSFKTKI